MTLKELNEYLLVNTNQWFIGAQNIEVKEDVLIGLTKRALSYYQNHNPFKYRAHNFSITTNDMRLAVIDGRPIIGVHSIYYSDPIYTDTKMTDYEFNPRNKSLKTMLTGIYHIDFLVKPIIDDITYDDEIFLDMMLGLYLMYVAEVRKGFKLNDLPFENDADELYAEGKEIFNEARERLNEEDNSWYLAIK